jgi:hypothetical protein
VAWRPVCRRGSPLPFPSLLLASRCMHPMEAVIRAGGAGRWLPLHGGGLISWLRFPAAETRTASTERKACFLRRGRRCAAASIVRRFTRRRDCGKGHALKRDSSYVRAEKQMAARKMIASHVGRDQQSQNASALELTSFLDTQPCHLSTCSPPPTLAAASTARPTTVFQAADIHTDILAHPPTMTPHC